MDTDKLKLNCVYLLRELLSLNLESDEIILYILKKTSLFSTLNYLLRKSSPNKNLLELEILWLIQDLTYICKTKEVLDSLMEEVLGMSELKSMNL